MTLPSTARDALLLVARVLLGIVLIAHGWQKLATYGIAGTAGSFAQMGVPLPAVSAVFAVVVELVGGAALLLGAATVVAGALVVLDMLGAFLLVRRQAFRTCLALDNSCAPPKPVRACVRSA